ncbi:MAG TPA: zinc ribbon domain-containing protein [Armatimonadota bacterium]|nr:zinc ribbon domain-containing protein [Armatimonadota bacterium]
MSDERPIAFTDNYEDLSTEKGFQFKFNCEHCGNGYMSTFQPNRLGQAGGMLQAAGSLLGGIFDRVAYGAHTLGEAAQGKQHDAALRKAVEEISPCFVQCRRCGAWVCRDVCFNTKANLCKQCAPIAEEEETSIRAAHVETQVTNDLFLEENKRMSAKGKEVAAKCKKCGQPTLGKKFCPNCGTPATTTPSFCPECGKKLTPGAQFCGECGESLSE